MRCRSPPHASRIRHFWATFPSKSSLVEVRNLWVTCGVRHATPKPLSNSRLSPMNASMTYVATVAWPGVQEAAEGLKMQKLGLQALTASLLQRRLAKGEQCADWQAPALSDECALALAHHTLRTLLFLLAQSRSFSQCFTVTRSWGRCERDCNALVLVFLVSHVCVCELVCCACCHLPFRATCLERCMRVRL